MRPQSLRQVDDAYRALVEKVDDFAASVETRRRADLACRPGCAGCCQVWLTVSPVEAAAMRAALASLSDAEIRAIAERGQREHEREARGEPPRCAMLDAEGRCGVYEARPLVCRTQGLPLQYPEGTIPEAVVRGRTQRGQLTYCPLNFTEAAPSGADVLDAERVNQMLALVNRRFSEERGLDPTARLSLTELAALRAPCGTPV
jgi:Fe-S-cluster containining protein